MLSFYKEKAEQKPQEEVESKAEIAV